MNQEIFLKINGVKIKVTTSYSKYHDYLCSYFNKVIVDSKDSQDQDIEIIADWKKDFLGNNPLGISIKEGANAIGANTFISAGGISAIKKIGRKKKVKLDFKLKESKLTLWATSRSKAIKDKLRYDIFRWPQEPYFFELTFVLIYYPLFWYLEYFKNTHILHASAVKIKDKCILICGLEGIGKTTLSLSLAKEENAILFSDNLVFYDKNNIAACYEPIRIHKSDEKSLWEGRFEKINKFRTLKDFYEPVTFNSDLNSHPDIAFIPLFGKEFQTKEVLPGQFVNKILNINQLTAELGNYNEYASLLSLLNPDFKIWDSRHDALLSLLGRTCCYEISMHKPDGVKANIEKLKNFIYKTCAK